MAHTLASDKALTRDGEDVEVCVIDPEQEQAIRQRRARLRILREGIEKGSNVGNSANVSRKRNRDSYVLFSPLHIPPQISLLSILFFHVFKTLF